MVSQKAKFDNSRISINTKLSFMVRVFFGIDLGLNSSPQMPVHLVFKASGHHTCTQVVFGELVRAS